LRPKSGYVTKRNGFGLACDLAMTLPVSRTAMS
jgi:hypothetical protein